MFTAVDQCQATLSLEDGDYRVAERCYAALGDIAKARFLHDVNQISADPKHPLVQARIAVLNKQFKRAEAILLEQGRIDDVILMYTTPLYFFFSISVSIFVL